MYRMQRGCLIAALLLVVVLFCAVPNCPAPLTHFNAWQIQYFGSTVNPAAAPSADPDGDGQNNLAEFTAGTDPLDPNSCIRILAVTATTDTVANAKNVPGKGLGVIQPSIAVVVTYFGSGGAGFTPPPKTNVLEYSTTTPASGDFISTGVTNILLQPGDVVTNMVDFGAATNGPVLFYRVRVLQ